MNLKCVEAGCVWRCLTGVCHTVLCVQAKHAVAGNTSWGIDGDEGKLVDMKQYGVWDAYSVKAQTYKTAIEVRQCLPQPGFAKNCLISDDGSGSSL